MASQATTNAQGWVLQDWRPDGPAFWQGHGRKIARRNLWNSIPCLLSAFSVWRVRTVAAIAGKRG